MYCTQYAFYAYQIWSPQGHGLSVEYRRGQLTTSLVLGFKFLVLALNCQSLALASDYQFLALALACQSLALSLEVVLDIALNSNFLATKPAPACILTSVKKYLDFIPEQSCSAGSVESWKAVQQEADFHLLHHLLEKSSAAQPPQCWRVFSHSGLFMCPHRARIGDRMLSDFVLMKCNKHV